MGNFRKLRVWQLSKDLAVNIYKITQKQPFTKDYGLKDQIQRSAVSIPSNIAEGDESGTLRDPFWIPFSMSVIKYRHTIVPSYRRTIFNFSEKTYRYCHNNILFQLVDTYYDNFLTSCLYKFTFQTF